MKFIIRRGVVVLSLTADHCTPSFLSVDPDTFSDVIVSQDTVSSEQLGPGVYNKLTSCFSSQVGWVKLVYQLCRRNGVMHPIHILLSFWRLEVKTKVSAGPYYPVFRKIFMEISLGDMNYRPVCLHHWFGCREKRWLSSYGNSQKSIRNQFIFLRTIRKEWLRDLPQISTFLSASISHSPGRPALIVHILPSCGLKAPL